MHIQFIDSHCHLDFPDFQNDTPAYLETMRQNQVIAALCIGVTLEDFPRVLKLAHDYANLWATVGVHPENSLDNEVSVDSLVALGSDPRVVAVGETGLDYYWHKDQPQWQKDRFCRHIQAAKQLKKPLIIHTREAASDTLAILKSENADEVAGVMHCFTESWEIAQQALDLGFYISISGIVTFKNAHVVQDVARKVPLERLLIETDSPYLAPVPFRGKTNQPAYVRYVAEKIADLREISLAEVAEASTANFFRLFSTARLN